jgi:hypothetical protein
MCHSHHRCFAVWHSCRQLPYSHLRPQSPVTLADGSTLPIEHVRPGMLTWGGARVQHVVRIDYDAVVPMVSLPGAAGNAAISRHSVVSKVNYLSSAGSGPTLVTPWHPLRVDGDWVFPCNVVAPCPVYMTCVYNVVLDSGHVCSPARHP